MQCGHIQALELFYLIRDRLEHTDYTEHRSPASVNQFSYCILGATEEICSDDGTEHGDGQADGRLAFLERPPCGKVQPHHLAELLGHRDTCDQNVVTLLCRPPTYIRHTLDTRQIGE